jgi:CarboxypepD_reg-like domain/TonB-dependent Receptor Plug Domain
MKWLTLVAICLIATGSTLAQLRNTISGYVIDAEDGESLIGANIYVADIEKGTTSNTYGFYSLSLAPGEYEIQFTYLGYRGIVQTVSLQEGNVNLNIELTLIASELEEVLITSEIEDQNVTELQMSVERLDMKTVEKLPTLLGEVEILRTILLLPGVSTVGEGATGFNVRGGSIDQNLVLLDEAPVYNSSHLFGFYSVFNPDAVKDIQLYKGGIPSRYGGRLSSILDVHMKEGNNKGFQMQGGVGFIFSRLAIEAPIVKDKASFIIAGRRSYADILAKPFLNEDLNDSALNFWDLTLKTNWQINSNNRIFLSGYMGRDKFRFGNDAGFDWGNQTATLRWNHLFSERVFSNFTFYYSNYDYQLSFGADSENTFDWNAGIINYAFKPEFSFYITPSSVLRFGGEVTYYDFEPGTAIGVSEGEIADISLDNKYAIESALFVEHHLDLGKKWELNYGLRLSQFNYIGPGRTYTFEDDPFGPGQIPVDFQEYGKWESIQTYFNLEPRIAAKYQLDETSSIKASYNRMAQYIHLISNTTASTPVDIWTPSTNNIAPQLADQVALGYFLNMSENTYEASVEVYYKAMQNLVDYIDGADLLLNEFLEGDLLPGKGRAYGVELQAKKVKGDFTAWASYTYSVSERLVVGVNGDEWYPSRFDQTHNLSLTGFYQLPGRWSFSTSFLFNTGTPVTFATSRVEQQGYVIPHNALDVRNNVRIPSYHRLDISATLDSKNKPGRRWKGRWVFSIYNVYSRRNPFSIYFSQEDNRIPPGIPVNTEAIRLSVIGNYIPSVSYNFTFK